LNEKVILYSLAALTTFGGFYIAIKPQPISSFLKTFYSNYPLVRYAGEKQLTSRPVFIRLFGSVIILAGLVGIVGVFLK
jgi:hypothetical protein